MFNKLIDSKKKNKKRNNNKKIKKIVFYQNKSKQDKSAAKDEAGREAKTNKKLGPKTFKSSNIK